MSGSAPNAVRSRTWVISSTGGQTVRGYLPSWAQNDPSTAGVRPERLGIALADVILQADLGGLILSVTHAQEPAEAMAVLAVTLECKPFGEDDEPRIPVVSIQIVDDFWLTGLDPDAVDEVGQQLRALGESLVTRVGPALHAARNDWTIHHPAPRPQG